MFFRLQLPAACCPWWRRSPGSHHQGTRGLSPWENTEKNGARMWGKTWETYSYGKHPETYIGTYRRTWEKSWKTMGNNNYRWRFQNGNIIYDDDLMIWSWNFVRGISRPPWLMGLPFPYYSHATTTLETPLFRSGRWWEWGFHQLRGPGPKFHGSNMVNILLAITILCMCKN